MTYTVRLMSIDKYGACNDEELENVSAIAYDDCHKIYLCEKEDEAQAKAYGYDLYEVNDLPYIYEGSCPLRFISAWNHDKHPSFGLEQCFVGDLGIGVMDEKGNVVSHSLTVDELGPDIITVNKYKIKKGATK